MIGIEGFYADSEFRRPTPHNQWII